MTTKTGKKHSSITEGSGNVFADTGVPEPEQALAKAKLAAKIAAAIEEEELTQTEAAELTGEICQYYAGAIRIAPSTRAHGRCRVVQSL